MLTLISSIPTTVREGFDVQDLPHRAASVRLEHLSEVGGGSAQGFGCPNEYSCSSYCRSIKYRCGYCEGFLRLRCHCCGV